MAPTRLRIPARRTSPNGSEPLLEGVPGFRDLGGFPTRDGGTTRRGVLFRSPCPSEATARDMRTLQTLGLAVRIDLRTSYELRDAPPVDIGELACAHVPILDAPDPGRFESRLRVKVGSRRNQSPVLEACLEDGVAVAHVFHLLAERTPAVVHCTTGSDRTGLIAALAMRLVGVPDLVICADYALSRPSGIASGGAAMNELLETLDKRWGSAAQYLLAHGCTQDQVQAFQAAFTNVVDLRDGGTGRGTGGDLEQVDGTIGLQTAEY